MRCFLFAVIIMCALLACGNAQPLQVESFDRSGVPARGQTDIERDLLRRISVHRRGDVADAIDIQRKLAAYYRAKGDDDRAQIAEQRAAAAADLSMNPATTRPLGSVQAPQFGQVPMVAPGTGRIPARGSVPYGQPQTRPLPGGTTGNRTLPNYGGIPAPAYGAIPVPTPGTPSGPGAPPSNTPAPPVAEDTATPTPAIPVDVPDTGTPQGSGASAIRVYEGAPLVNQEPASAPAEPPVPAPAVAVAPATPAQQSPFAGNYTVMQGQMLHTWEFRRDGTFTHGWAAPGAGTAAANYEAGMFSTAGGYLTLIVLQRSAASRGQTVGGAAGTARETRRLRFDARQDAIVLDGVVMKPKGR